MEIVGQENRTANVRTDAFFVCVAERQAEGHRGELIQIGNKAPAMIPQRLHFQLLLVSALILAVLHAKIRVSNGCVLKRTRTKANAFAGTTTAEIFKAGSQVHPGSGRPVESIANREALDGAVADDGKQESGLAYAFARRRCGIRQPEERDAVEAEIGIDQRDALFEGDFGFGSVKLPSRMLRIANCEPGVADDIEIRGHALDFLGFKINGIFGDQQRGVGVAFQFHIAVDIVERAMAGLNVELCIIGFQVLVFKIKLHVPARQRFEGCAVVLDVIRLQTHFAVMNVHIVVRYENVALPPLWPFSRNLGDASRRCLRQANLLCGTLA